MEELNHKKANPWQAPPITHHETVYTKKEKTNPDIKPQRIRIEYTPSEGIRKSGMSYIKYQLDINENQKITGKFDVDKAGTKEIIVDDKNLWKTVDKKDFTLSLKKKKFLFGKERVDSKKFRLVDLGTKCNMEKDVKLSGFDTTFLFSVNTPIKEKEMEQIPFQKLIVDSFPEPYKGGQL